MRINTECKNTMNRVMRMQMTMCCSEYVVRRSPYVSSWEQSCNV